MKCYFLLLTVITLVAFPACERRPEGNQSNGVKDAIGARPYEEIRDAAEDATDAVQDAGQDIKDTVNGL
jgi:hypothetical protein